MEESSLSLPGLLFETTVFYSAPQRFHDLRESTVEVPHAPVTHRDTLRRRSRSAIGPTQVPLLSMFWPQISGRDTLWIRGSPGGCYCFRDGQELEKECHLAPQGDPWDPGSRILRLQTLRILVDCNEMEIIVGCVRWVSE